MKIRYALMVLPVAMLLAGAGCTKKADDLAADAVKPITVPIAALDEANEVMAEANAVARRDADSIENLLPVAMVLTEGRQVPASGVERLAAKTFGCLDRIGYVRVSREVATHDIVHDALMTLFSVREAVVDGMYNSLWLSSLIVDEIRGVGDNTVEVRISGEMVSSGTCDDPRLKEQIEATVRQYRPNYRILLNGTEKNWECFGDMTGECAP